MGLSCSLRVALTIRHDLAAFFSLFFSPFFFSFLRASQLNWLHHLLFTASLRARPTGRVTGSRPIRMPGMKIVRFRSDIDLVDIATSSSSDSEISTLEIPLAAAW